MPKSGGADSSQAYRMFETRSFLTDLESLGSAAEKRLLTKLCDGVYPALCQTPYFGPNIKRLKNWDPPTWRYRVGDWRFFYEIDEAKRIVFMTAADHRKEAYR